MRGLAEDFKGSGRDSNVLLISRAQDEKGAVPGQETKGA